MALQLERFLVPGSKKSRTTHTINDINYKKNFLQCICRWEGEADKPAIFRKHQLTSEPYTGAEMESPYGGRFNTTFIDKEFSDLRPT